MSNPCIHSGTYLLGGHAVCIRSVYPTVQRMCADYRTSLPAEFTVSATEADIRYEAEQTQLAAREEGRKPVNYSDSYLETLVVYRHLATRLIPHGVLLFHGSAVAADGQCYLFTARSGTGKSTHTRLWRELLGERAVMVNDDKPLIGITPQGVTVFGTPWNGKHHLSRNIQVPLKAICLVTRGQENRVIPVDPSEIQHELLTQIFFPQEASLRLQVLRLLETLCQHVRFYRMSCNMELEAAQVAYEAMKG